MSFVWIDYSHIAKRLFDFRDRWRIKEACLRNVISRSYYCLINLAREYAASFEKHKYLRKRTTDVHGVVIEIYEKADNAEANALANLLRDFRDLRTTADYDKISSPPIDESVAEDALLWVQHGTETINKLSLNGISF